MIKIMTDLSADIPKEVAKEYGEKACVRCKHHLVDSDLEPCKYCIHFSKFVFHRGYVC